MTFPKFTYMQVSRKRSAQIAFIAAWMPFFLFMTYIYICVNVKLLEQFNISAGLLEPVDSEFFLAYLMFQLPFMFFFTLFVGPGLIATDIRNQALPMILSKPILQWQYLFGKFSVLFILLSALSWIPATILFIAQTAAVPAASPWRENFWSHSLWIWGSIMAFSAIVIITFTLLILFFSCLTRNARFASVAMIMFIIGSMVVAPVARAIFDSNNWMVISPTANLLSVAKALFGEGPREVVPIGLSISYIVFVWTICLAYLFRHIRAFQLYKE